MMYTRREQYDVLSNIHLHDGETKRVNCPFCGGRYTLTVTNKDGAVVWNCYKASCSAKGGKRVGYSLDSIKTKYTSKAVEPKKMIRTPLPEINSSPEHHEQVMQYLSANNCTKAYEDRAIDITYDPAKNRVLFWTNKGEGAVGRSLSGAKPKWLSYGNTSGILTVGNSTTGLIVEDAASACSVYTTGIYTGIALLGTNVSPEQRQQLRHYKKLYLCLDSDASGVALRLYKRLSAYMNLSVCFLKEDLKYLTATSIMETVNESERIGRNRL